MRFPLRQLFVSIALIAVTVRALHAQNGNPVVLYTLDGSRPGERLGWSLSTPGDLNGDGAPDILAGGPGDFISGGFPGIVRAYSGLDGSVLYTVSGQVNADGFGMTIAMLPDIDGDGRPDFAVGAPYDDAVGLDSGSVYVFSGASGSLVQKMSGGAAGDAFGWSLCNGRDFDGDGVPDLIVGAPLADVPLPDSGTVSLFDPATGIPLNSWNGATALAELGYSVAATLRGGAPLTQFIFAGAPGMQSGAGSGTVLFWEPNQSPTPFYSPSAGVATGITLSGFTAAAGNLTSAYIAIGTVMSGQSSITLYSEGYYDSNFASLGSFLGPPTLSVSAVADETINGQFLVANSSGTSPWSGIWFDYDWQGDLTGLGALNWDGAGLARAWSVAGLRYLNADSRRDFAVGDPSVALAGQDSGRVAVFLTTAPYQPPAVYCTAKTNSQGCTPRIGFQGAPTLSVGDNFHVNATGVMNNKPGLMLWSLNSNSIPFGGGTLCVGPLFHRTALQFSGGNPPPSDCSGAYSFHFSQAYMNAQALSPGVTIFCQYYSRDVGFPAPANIGLTDAVRFTVLP